SRRDHDLGAVAAQHRDLLLAHLVGHHEDAPVPLPRRRDRETDSRVPGGRLDDRAAGTELPLALGRLDHREPDPVLVRPAGVPELELGEDRAGHVAGHAGEADDGREADEVDHGGILPGHPGRKRTAARPRRHHFNLYSEFRSALSPLRTGGRLVTVTDELLANAEGYADTFDRGDLPMPPAKGERAE